MLAGSCMTSNPPAAHHSTSPTTAHRHPPHLLGEPRGGIRQDGCHAAVVGAAQEEGAGAGPEVVRDQGGCRGLRLEAGVGGGVATHHQLQGVVGAEPGRTRGGEDMPSAGTRATAWHAIRSSQPPHHLHPPTASTASTHPPPVGRPPPSLQTASQWFRQWSAQAPRRAVHAPPASPPRSPPPAGMAGRAPGGQWVEK